MQVLRMISTGIAWRSLRQVDSAHRYDVSKRLCLRQRRRERAQRNGRERVSSSRRGSDPTITPLSILIVLNITESILWQLCITFKRLIAIDLFPFQIILSVRSLMKSGWNSTIRQRYVVQPAWILIQCCAEASVDVRVSILQTVWRNNWK